MKLCLGHRRDRLWTAFRTFWISSQNGLTGLVGVSNSGKPGSEFCPSPPSLVWACQAPGVEGLRFVSCAMVDFHESCRLFRWCQCGERCGCCHLLPPLSEQVHVAALSPAWLAECCYFSPLAGCLPGADAHAGWLPGESSCSGPQVFLSSSVQYTFLLARTSVGYPLSTGMGFKKLPLGG